MQLLRIREVEVLDGFRLRLTLTDGSRLERDVSPLMAGPVFEPLRRDPRAFRMARVEGGTVVWPNGADLCPDVLIWGGPPPGEEKESGGNPPRAAAEFQARLDAADVGKYGLPETEPSVRRRRAILDEP
jgi:hypothetical protein